MQKQTGLIAKKEVISSYNIDPKTFKKYISPILPILNLPNRAKFITPNQLKIIHGFLGEP